jgi:hypothetical protein
MAGMFLGTEDRSYFSILQLDNQGKARSYTHLLNLQMQCGKNLLADLSK